MKISHLIIASSILFSIASCCSLGSDDEMIATLDFSLQFFDLECEENLFDENGPLSAENISFRIGVAGNELEPADIDPDGSFLFSLFGNDLNFNESAEGNLQIFIERNTGETDILKIFSQSNTGRCDRVSFSLDTAEFNGSPQDIESGQLLILKLS